MTDTETKLADALRAIDEAMQGVLPYFEIRDKIGTVDFPESAHGVVVRALAAHDTARAQPARKPDGYAYRYGDGFIRYNRGERVNGLDPIEAIPFYFAPPAQPASVADGWQPKKPLPLDQQVELVRAKWPQAHAAKGPQDEHLITVPGFKLPPGFSADICTLLFIASPGYPYEPPRCFWVDIPNLLFKGMNIPHTNRSNLPRNFPRWRGLTWFAWKLQSWSPFDLTLLNVVYAIDNSLKGLAQRLNKDAAPQPQAKESE